MAKRQQVQAEHTVDLLNSKDSKRKRARYHHHRVMIITGETQRDFE